MALYHKDLGFPAGMERLSGTLRLKYGNHSRAAAKTDRYGVIALSDLLEVDEATLVEAELSPDGRLVKALYRVRYNRTLDLCLVVNPDGFVRTVWLNERRDQHNTVKFGRYVRP